MSALQFTKIYKKYEKRPILEDISFELNHGECSILTGQNGSGKTTLLRILAGFEKPDQFTVKTGYNELNWRQFKSSHQNYIMYMHQQPYMFEGTVVSNLEYALSKKMDAKTRKSRIRQALQWAGLTDLAHDQAKHLSGGEYQRVALARAWLRNPKILLLDEPTANMDAEARLKTTMMLKQLREEGMTLLIASHDTGHFSSIITEHLHLQSGGIHKLKTKHPDHSDAQDTNNIIFLSKDNIAS